MKTKVAIEIDRGLWRKAQHWAAEEGTSIAAFLSQQLEKMLLQRQEQLDEKARRVREYAAARKRALAQLRQAKPVGWKRPASRDELHER
jgi:hypothetical protein